MSVFRYGISFSFINLIISDLEKMKKQMEEEIRAQLLANQEAMNDMDWDTKVSFRKKKNPD